MGASSVISAPNSPWHLMGNFVWEKDWIHFWEDRRGNQACKAGMWQLCHFQQMMHNNKYSSFKFMYCIRNLAFCISDALTIWWLLDYVPLNFAPGSQILEKLQTLQTFLLNPSTLFPFEAHCEYSWCAITGNTHIYVDTMCNLWINVALAHGCQIILWSTIFTLGFTILYGVPLLYFSLHNGNQVSFFEVEVSFLDIWTIRSLNKVQDWIFHSKSFDFT